MQQKQLTKLKATIVWNIEQVIEWLTSVECRAVNVAKQARKLQATLEGCNPKLWLAGLLTDGGKV